MQLSKMKTIDEAAKEYARMSDDKFANSAKKYDAFDLKQAFEDGSEFAQRWISVEDELPINNSNVLYKDSDGKEFLAFYTNELKKWMKYRPIGSPIECNNITHWRPIEVKKTTCTQH